MTTAESRPSAAVDLIYGRAQHLASLLPAHLDLDSYIGTATAQLYNDAKLMAAAEASPDSLMIALTECAQLGHYPDGKSYYLTPRSRKGRPVILGVEGYRGVVQRMYNSDRVGKVIVREVCERDEFDFTEGMDDHPLHRSAANRQRTGAGYFGESGTADRGEMVGVYAYAKFLNGEYSRVTLLSREDVLAARASGGYSPDDEYNPWNRLDGGPDHPEFRGRSMWWKTALKRLEPWVPTSAEDLRTRSAALQVRQERPPVQLASAPSPAVAAPARALPAPKRKPPQRRRQEQPDPPRTDVVTKALTDALGKKFDKIGITEGDERDSYLHILANKDRGADLTDHDRRTALAALGELGEDATVEDLQNLCNPDAGDPEAS